MAQTILQHTIASNSEQAIQMAKDSIVMKPLLQMLPFEATNGMSFTSATGTVPSISVSGINQGYSSSEGVLEPQDFKVAQYSARSEVDVRLADIDPLGVGNSRSVQDDLIHMGILNAFSSDMIYANQNTNTNQFFGLSRYMNALNGENVVDGGSTNDGSLTSIYFVKLGILGVGGIINAQASTVPTVADLGKQLVTAPDNNGQMTAYVSDFDWKAGIKVNQGGIGRLANIETQSNVTLPFLNTVLTYIKNGADAIICNRKGKTLLQGLQTSSLETRVLDSELGVAVETFQGLPIFIEDSITNTESQVS